MENCSQNEVKFYLSSKIAIAEGIPTEFVGKGEEEMGAITPFELTL